MADLILPFPLSTKLEIILMTFFVVTPSLDGLEIKQFATGPVFMERKRLR